MKSLVRLALRRPWWVIAAWIGVVAAASPFALRLKDALRGSTDAVQGSPSELVSRDVDRAFGQGSAFVFPAVLSSSETTVEDPPFAAAVLATEQALESAGMRAVGHYLNTGDTALVGRDRRSALLLVTPPAGTFFDAESQVERIRESVRAAGLGPGFHVDLTGVVALFHDMDASASDDLLRAERVGIPLTLLVLLVVFGAPVAAALPLLVAAGATVITLAVLYGLSQVMPVSVFAQNAVTMVGLGIGVDYALFLVSRSRDELAHGASFRQAVEIAATRTTHVVVVSGLAVCTGFLALLLVHIRFLHTLAFGGVAVVVAAVLMTLTLLPALLLVFGERVNWPRRFSMRTRRTGSLWERWARESMARPWRYLIPSVLVLVVLIAPTLRLKAWNVGAGDLAPPAEARLGYDRLARDFAPGWMGPVVLLAHSRDVSDLRSPERMQALAATFLRVARDPRIRVARTVPAEDGRTAMMLLVPRSPPESAEVMDLVRELRAARWSEARNGGIDVRVGGFSAAMIDFDEELFRSLRRVVPLVLAVTFVVLVIAFRSIVVPLKAIVMNLISVLAAYGFLVYVFQDGIGARAIGIEPPGGLTSFVVFMLFTILFGLSMDYEVFLLSRIREEYRRLGDNRAAVINGVSQTGGLITSAALIMVVLFASFAFTRLTATQQFGLGLAFAVALDATLIRVVLVPILMGLMGRANWWWVAS